MSENKTLVVFDIFLLSKETGASTLLRDIPLHGTVLPSVYSSSTAILSPLLALMWKHPKLWHCSSLTQRENRVIILLQMKIDWYIRVNSKTLSTRKNYQLTFQVSYSKILTGSLSYCCPLHWGQTWQDWGDTGLPFSLDPDQLPYCEPTSKRAGLYIKVQHK